LYDDPRQDAHDVATMISAIATARGWDQPAWDKLPHDAEERGVAGMRRRLSRAIDNRPPSLNREVESRRSRRLVAGAVIAAAAGLAMAGGVIAYEIRARPPILAPPRIAPMAAPDQPSVQPDDASADNGSPELASPPQPDVPGSGGAN
jgi:hypothetical protein